MNRRFTDIKNLFKTCFKSFPQEFHELPLSGSNRRYYRLIKDDITSIAVYNEDRVENEAFIYITGQLKNSGVNVPQLLTQDLNKNIYLVQDLGDVDLFQLVNESKHKNQDVSYLNWYKEVIKSMPAIQHETAKDFDFSVCYPRSAFDKQSMLWDLNYFKYHFLKLAYTPFHEQKLEDDFHRLADFLMEAPHEFFLFRDFQSRNIMIHENKPYFIDYQGGRKGALQYDLASLLFEAKTALSAEIREELLDFYLDVYSSYPFFNKKSFLKYFPAFVLIRSLQAFGAYGYRGYFERKPYFLQSIPPAIESLKWLLTNYDLGVKIPHLTVTLNHMLAEPIFHIPATLTGKLHVSIFSFSYRKGIPDDFTGNGGGYVFDCRVLPNPGLLEKYRESNGLNDQVKDFLLQKSETGKFLDDVKKLITASVEEYSKRGYEHLMISFGCTGGQHRSVFCAQQMYNWLKHRKDIEVSIFHKELIGVHHSTLVQTDQK